MPVTRSIGYTRRVKVKDLVELRFPSLGRGRKDLIKILDVLARSLVGALINLADHGGFEPKCLPVTHGVHPRTHWRRPDPCREPVLVARFGRPVVIETVDPCVQLVPYRLSWLVLGVTNDLGVSSDK